MHLRFQYSSSRRATPGNNNNKSGSPRTPVDSRGGIASPEWSGSGFGSGWTYPASKSTTKFSPKWTKHEGFHTINDGFHTIFQWKSSVFNQQSWTFRRISHQTGLSCRGTPPRIRSATETTSNLSEASLGIMLWWGLRAFFFKYENGDSSMILP